LSPRHIFAAIKMNDALLNTFLTASNLDYLHCAVKRHILMWRAEKVASTPSKADASLCHHPSQASGTLYDEEAGK
jgi:hypothetical protein